MTREALEKIVEGISKEQVSAILSLYSQSIETVKATAAQKEQELAAAKTELEGVKTQLSDRDKDIEALKKAAGSSEELQKNLAELQSKYDTETTSLSEKLTQQERQFATERYFANVQFTSDLAKKAAIHEFNEKAFAIKDGTFQGADTFIAEMKASNPAAFVTEAPPPEETPPEQEQPIQPFFSGQVQSGGTSKDENPFTFKNTFTQVRKVPEKP